MYLAALIGIFLFLFGLLLLILPEKIKWIYSVFDRTILVIDDAVMSARAAVGTMLLIVSALMLWLTWPYPSLWALNLVTLVIVFFGALLLFSPDKLKSLSDLCNRTILSRNEFVIGSRKTLGVLLVILGVYVIYIALSNYLNK